MGPSLSAPRIPDFVVSVLVKAFQIKCNMNTVGAQIGQTRGTFAIMPELLLGNDKTLNIFVSRWNLVSRRMFFNVVLLHICFLHRFRFKASWNSRQEKLDADLTAVCIRTCLSKAIFTARGELFLLSYIPAGREFNFALITSHRSQLRNSVFIESWKIRFTQEQPEFYFSF